MTTYTTYGICRGGCDHRHRTIEAAERCIDRDQRQCRRSGQCHYSDRAVVRVGADGWLEYLGGGTVTSSTGRAARL